MRKPSPQVQALWDRPEPYAIAVDVVAQHIDELGHTNNVHYLDWLQQCAWRHSGAVGFAADEMVATGCAMAVRDVRMSYLAATSSAAKPTAPECRQAHCCSQSR